MSNALTIRLWLQFGSLSRV